MRAAIKDNLMSDTEKTGGRVQLGFVGVAGRGYDSLMKDFAAFPDVEIVAVCDVYAPHLERAVEFTNGKAKGYHMIIKSCLPTRMFRRLSSRLRRTGTR